MKKTFFSLIIFALSVLQASIGIASTAYAAGPGSLIRVADSSSVYYVGEDGRRYAFPNSKTYHTWYEDFSEVEVVPSLLDYPLGGNVAYRPGTRLIKIESENNVYAVEPGNILRWVPSESVAEALFGSNWNKQIDDIPVIFFTDYTLEGTLQDSALSASEHPLGSVIRYEGSPTTYLVDYADGRVVKRMVDNGAFVGNRFQEQFVRTVNSSIAYPDGAAVAERESPLTNVRRSRIVRVDQPQTDPEPGAPALDSPALFVDSSVTEEGTGTLQRPYATLTAATTVVTPGVTIYIRGDVDQSRVYAEDFVFARSGTQTNHISLKPYPGERVTLQSDDAVEFAVSNWDVSDITFDHNGASGPLMYVRGTYNAFTDVSFMNGNNEGVVIPLTMHDVTFTRATFTSFKTTCVSIEKKVEKVTIDQSTLSRCGTYAVNFDISDGTLLQDFARMITVRGSTISSNATAINIKGVDDIKVVNNNISDNNSVAINVQYDPRNVDIIGNTIHTSSNGVYVASTNAKTPSLIDIFDNVFYGIDSSYVFKFDDVDSLRVVHNTIADSTAAGMIVLSGGISSGMIRNNLFYDTGDNLIDLQQKAVKSNNGWYGTAQPTGLEGTSDVIANSTTTDPFVDGSSHDYNLKPGEVLIDAAIEIGLTSVDRAGNPRVKGIAPDIGAYEVQ